VNLIERSRNLSVIAFHEKAGRSQVDSSLASFGAPEFLGIATAAVAPDGTFSMELPNFSADPIVSDDGTAELKFWISRLKDHYFLSPQPTEGIETKAPSMRISRSYPAEVTFQAVSLQDLR
jgi:hypothetical protein